MPKSRIEDIPAGDADPDDRTGKELPAEIREMADPPAQRQDLSEEEVLRLEAKGWVRREDDATDRRAWRVYLTDEVGPAMRELRAVAAELRRDALAGLSAAERERFVDTLLAIKANLAKLPPGAGAGDNVPRRGRRP